MSAIWGQVSFKETIKEQTDLWMREPYERKCKLDRIRECRQPFFYMGCGLQHVTEEAKEEILPILDEERQICFTADCILDNRQELLEKLQITDTKIPDGTLMYQAFLKWGMDCFHYFRGLFSVAVYDMEKRVLYLASDQVASRCLYYCVKDKTVTFSTLIEPIRRVHADIGHNELFLKDFATAPGLMPNIMPTETPYEGIYKLNTGTCLTITEQGIEEHTYWALDQTKPPLRFRKAEEYGRYFRNLYEECVKDALRTSDNVSIAMSSGLDSASVGALAADMLAKNGKKLYSYTYVPYEKGTKSAHRNLILDEREDVRKIAAMHPNIETYFLNNQGKNCYEQLDFCLESMEIPFKAFVNFPNLIEICQQAARAGCQVVLTGQMGNGSVSHGYIDDVLYDLYKHKKYVSFLRNLNRYSKTVKESRKAALRGCIRYFNHANQVYANREFRYEPDNPFLSNRVPDNYPMKERYESGGVTCMERVPASQKQYREFICKNAMYTYMGEYETKLGLAAGVVLRDATKDVRMLEFCYHLPYELFAHRGTPRWLIRENLRDILPKKLLDNWMRYGVQNSDWLLRIKRDWEQIYTEMVEDIKQEKVQHYLNQEEACRFLKEMHNLSEQEADIQLSYLVYLCVLSRFLQKE